MESEAELVEPVPPVLVGPAEGLAELDLELVAFRQLAELGEVGAVEAEAELVEAEVELVEPVPLVPVEPAEE